MVYFLEYPSFKNSRNVASLQAHFCAAYGHSEILECPVRRHLGEGEHVAREVAPGDDRLHLVERRDVLPPPLHSGGEEGERVRGGEERRRGVKR